MKKSLLIIAAATAIVSCSQSEKLNINTEQLEIGFTKVYIEKNTKAYNTVTNLEQSGNTFGVFGYKTTATAGEQKVFGERTGETAGVKVTYGSGENADWAYTPLRYWDKVASSYSFYAYVPHQDQISSNVTSITFDDTNKQLSINGFKQTTSQATMIDLMTDLESKVGMTTGIGTNDVEFTFKHILSNINIRMALSADLKADETNNPVTVNSVSIGAIKMDGSYAYNEGYKWSLTNPQVTSATTFNATQTSNKVFDARVLKAISASVTGGATLEAAKVDVNATEVPALTDLLFVPQTVIDDYVINVEYLINTQQYNKTIKLKDFLKTNDDSALTTWEPGYKYTYVLVIGPTPILFDVSGITGWSDGGTYIYTIN